MPSPRIFGAKSLAALVVKSQSCAVIASMFWVAPGAAATMFVVSEGEVKVLFVRIAVAAAQAALMLAYVIFLMTFDAALSTIANSSASTGTVLAVAKWIWPAICAA